MKSASASILWCKVWQYYWSRCSLARPLHFALILFTQRHFPFAESLPSKARRISRRWCHVMKARRARVWCLLIASFLTHLTIPRLVMINLMALFEPLLSPPGQTLSLVGLGTHCLLGDCSGLGLDKKLAYLSTHVLTLLPQLGSIYGWLMITWDLLRRN